MNKVRLPSLLDTFNLLDLIKCDYYHSKDEFFLYQWTPIGVKRIGWIAITIVPNNELRALHMFIKLNKVTKKEIIHIILLSFDKSLQFPKLGSSLRININL